MTDEQDFLLTSCRLSRQTCPVSILEFPFLRGSYRQGGGIVYDNVWMGCPRRKPCIDNFVYTYVFHPWAVAGPARSSRHPQQQADIEEVQNKNVYPLFLFKIGWDEQKTISCHSPFKECQKLWRFDRLSVIFFVSYKASNTYRTLSEVIILILAFNKKLILAFILEKKHINYKSAK